MLEELYLQLWILGSSVLDSPFILCISLCQVHQLVAAPCLQNLPRIVCLQIVVYLADGLQSDNQIFTWHDYWLSFDRTRTRELWRFFTMSIVHLDSYHLTSNLRAQLVFGVLFEVSNRQVTSYCIWDIYSME